MACKALTGREQSHSSLFSPQLDQLDMWTVGHVASEVDATHVLLPPLPREGPEDPSLDSAPWVMTVASGSVRAAPTPHPAKKKDPHVSHQGLPSTLVSLQRLGSCPKCNSGTS